MTMFDKKRIQNIIDQFEKEKHNNSNAIKIDTAILIAISSAVGGALLGMLFAPEKGKKTRKNLVKKGDKYLKDFKKNSEDLSQQLKKNTEDLSQQLKKNTDSILEKSKMKVQNLKQDIEDYSEWTFQELYERAKKLQIAGYSQMNKSELIQAIEDQ